MGLVYHKLLLYGEVNRFIKCPSAIKMTIDFFLPWSCEYVQCDEISQLKKVAREIRNS